MGSTRHEGEGEGAAVPRTPGVSGRSKQLAPRVGQTHRGRCWAGVRAPGLGTGRPQGRSLAEERLTVLRAWTVAAAPPPANCAAPQLCDAVPRLL